MKENRHPKLVPESRIDTITKSLPLGTPGHLLLLRNSSWVLPLEKGEKKSMETCFPPFPKEASEGRRIRQPFNLAWFTLVELIVVITILTILGTIAFVNLGGFQGSARDGTRVSDLANLSQGLEVYQVKKGVYPTPNNLTVTGTIQQWTLNGGLVGFSVSNPIDPLTKTGYVYSILNGGSYYQLGAEMESPVSQIASPMIDRAYADGLKTAFLKGNYVSDPSLPSLIIIPSSVPTTAGSGGVFSPEVCFVTNGSSKNTVSSGTGSCVKKKDVSLKSLDSSLVGYWDFEEPFNSGWVIYYPDSSGNNHHAFSSWSIQWAWYIAPTSTGWYLWKWLYFTSGSLILWNEADILYPYKEFTISIIANLFEYKSAYPYLLNSLQSTFNYMGDPNWPNWSDQYEPEAIWMQLISRSSTWASIENHRWYVSWNVFRTYKVNIFSFTFFGGSMKTYVNWSLYWEVKINTWVLLATDYFPAYMTQTLVLWGNRNNRTRDFHWIIDDVKIYNRALSDSEIRQQAKVAGF